MQHPRGIHIIKLKTGLSSFIPICEHEHLHYNRARLKQKQF